MTKEKLIEIESEIPQFNLYPPDYDGKMEFTWYYVKSQEELDALKRYRYEEDAEAQKFQPEEFPCWICAMADNYDGEIRTLDETIRSINWYLNQLNYLTGGKSYEI